MNHDELLEAAKELMMMEFMDDSNVQAFMWFQQATQILHSETSNPPRRTQRLMNCNREAGHEKLYKDYFADEPVYPANIFRRRSRMRKKMFVRIVDTLEDHSEYSEWRVDATCKQGISPFKKCTVSIFQLAYGALADHNDEYIRISEHTALDCLTIFCKCVIEKTETKYLRRLNSNDIQRLLHFHPERHGFPDMFGSIDYMHWHWRNCLVAWKGQFTRGDHRVPSIMLKVIASVDLWIWHTFFGVVGSNNDINVLNQSILFNDVMHGYALEIQFTVNGMTYTKGYYLADGIYPE